MTIADIKKTTETKMEQSIAAFKNNLTRIRTGRANPALLDTIQVDYYGSMLPLSQVANVSLMDSRTISFDEAISRNLGIMDATAFALCRDQKLPIKVFSIIKNGALKRVVLGEDEGTLVYA